MISIRLGAFTDEAAADFRGQIAAAKRCRLSSIDFRFADGKNILGIGEEEAREYRRVACGEGIRIGAVGSPIGKTPLSEPLSRTLDALRRACAAAHLLGTDEIRVFSFFGAEGQGEEVARRLGEMARAARAEGAALYLENEKGVYGDTAERMRELLCAADGLGQIFDAENYLQVEGDVGAALRLLAPSADRFHVKDYSGKSGEHVPAGEGDGRWREIVGALSHDAAFTLEPHLVAFAGFSSIDSTSIRSRFTDPAEAFGAAVDAFRGILEEAGYREMDGKWRKGAEKCARR